MTSWHDLDVGVRFTSPPRAVTDDDVATLIRVGGYIHPIFTDAGYVATTPFGRHPLPAQAVLLLMGGMVEATGRFDASVIALVGLDAARFTVPAFAGDELRVEVVVVAREPDPDRPRGVLSMEWTCRNQVDSVVTTVTARMLFATD